MVSDLHFQLMTYFYVFLLFNQCQLILIIFYNLVSLMNYMRIFYLNSDFVSKDDSNRDCMSILFYLGLLLKNILEVQLILVCFYFWNFSNLLSKIFSQKHFICSSNLFLNLFYFLSIILLILVSTLFQNCFYQELIEKVDQ